MTERNYLHVVLFGGRFDGPTGLAWRIDALHEKLWAYICKDPSTPGCRSTAAPHRGHVDVTAVEGVEGAEVYEKVGYDLDEGVVYYRRGGVPFDPLSIVPDRITVDSPEPMVTAEHVNCPCVLVPLRELR